MSGHMCVSDWNDGDPRVFLTSTETRPVDRCDFYGLHFGVCTIAKIALGLLVRIAHAVYAYSSASRIDSFILRQHCI